MKGVYFKKSPCGTRKNKANQSQIQAYVLAWIEKKLLEHLLIRKDKAEFFDFEQHSEWTGGWISVRIPPVVRDITVF